MAIAGSRRGSVMARSSMARNRQSMTAAMATAAQAAAADASAHASMPEDPAGPGRGTHAQSYTGGSAMTVCLQGVDCSLHEACS